MPKLIDISLPLTFGKSIAWEGLSPAGSKEILSIEQGVRVSTLTIDTHAGTHADAPSHFLSDGVTINKIPLTSYIGRVQVLTITNKNEITREELKKKIMLMTERLICRTVTPFDGEHFTPPYVYLTPDAAEFLGEKKIKLIGIDGPSMDPAASKTLDAHKTLAKFNIAILENLFLNDAPDGEYELIALPLPLASDASPVRAVLRSI